jgi:oligopeptide transport system permease protein
MSQATSNRETDRYAALLDEARRIKGVSLAKDAWRRLRRNFVAMGALVYLILLILAAIFTPLLPLQSPIEQHLQPAEIDGHGNPPPHGQFLPPRAVAVELGLDDVDRTRPVYEDGQEGDAPFEIRLQKLFAGLGPFDRMLIETRLTLFGDWCIPSICGTDNLGRDVLARLFWGARISLMVGFVATLVSLVIGVSYGATAGYLGGHVDNIMMRIVDILYSIPFIFVVIFVITILDEESIRGWLDARGVDRIVVFYLVIGAIYWLTMARVVRGQVISLKNEQFIEAARTVGAGSRRIIFRHLVPNVLSVVIVYLTLTIPSVMLFEAFLSFLGLGVTPPDISWGVLAQEGIRVISPVKIYWWLIVFPGLALALTLFALNFLGDGLRDALDPRMKNR